MKIRKIAAAPRNEELDMINMIYAWSVATREDFNNLVRHLNLGRKLSWDGRPIVSFDDDEVAYYEELAVELEEWRKYAAQERKRIEQEQQAAQDRVPEPYLNPDGDEPEDEDFTLVQQKDVTSPPANAKDLDSLLDNYQSGGGPAATGNDLGNAPVTKANFGSIKIRKIS